MPHPGVAHLRAAFTLPFASGLVLVPLLLLAASAPLAAQIVTLQAIADTTIKRTSPDQSFGTQKTLALKEGGGRVLVRFDPAAITAAVASGSLASAQLRLYVGQNPGSWGPIGRTVDVYRLDAPWVETASTWDCADDTHLANAAPDCPAQWNGGTTEDDATDTIVVTNATTGWIQFDVTADVQAFLAGTADDGWLLQKSDEGQAGRLDLASREGTPGLGPQLILLSQSPTYDTVPPRLAIISPSQPVLVNTPQPAIAVAYSDAGSGVDTTTLHIALDAQDLTAACAITEPSATCTPPTLAAGSHTMTATVSDHAGNVATASTTFQLLVGPGAGTMTLAVGADSYITGKAPDREHGRAPILRVAKSGPSRALVSFDLSPLAAALAGGGPLVSAQLELQIAANGNNWGSAGRTVGTYALTVPWSEGAATWDCPADTNLDNHQPDCAVLWSGGTFAANPTATALITRGLAGTLDFDVTADVTAFLSGTANDGWLIKETAETLSGRVDFVSREAPSGTAAQLVVAFQVPSPLPTISITSPSDNSYLRTPTIQVTGQAGGSATAVSVNGQPATLGPGGAFTVALTLSQGPNEIVATASDPASNQATVSENVVLDTTPPTITLTSPASGAVTNQPQLTVAGTANDDSGVASVTVDGQPVTLTGNQFSTTVPLSPGANTVTVTATDLAGNIQTLTAGVTQYSVPVVAITSPADLSYVHATTVTVSGTVTVTGSGSAAVSVDGVAATVAGSAFTAAGVPLIEGGNTLTATAADGQGHVGTASINVVRDLTPPHIAIYTPAPGATIADSTVVVSGLVNDIVAGTVNAANATVTVNGLPATVANRSFVVSGVPLQPGTNVLTAVAVDAAGNQAQATVTVRQAAPAAPRIAAVSGNGQSAPIQTALAQPLQAALLDITGQPVVGKQVLFQAIGTDGTFDNGLRSYTVASDAAGHATAHFTVGSHAGAQLVQASSPGFAGPAQFVFSAQPGGPALIVVDSGDQQQGVAGQALPLPLVAVVVDAGANRLAGVPVTFAVVRGAGTFANGQQTLSLTTDSDGRVIAPFATDPAEGVANNIVTATMASLPAGPRASFTASALAAFDPSQTAVSGVALDNSNQPVVGATIRILGTAITTSTDAQGQFQLAGVPVGNLTLVVDGTTLQAPGSWPQLELNLTTVPGRNNSLRMPVYLLPLDLAHGIVVDETHGGTLTLPQLPGFALTIQPGSVTFPGGGHGGTVSVTVVHSDKVPMVPNFGQQPRLIVTIQPAGAQFNPPATLSMPNVEGLPAGRVTELYSFDHDLGHFVSIGPGTVSDDGTLVTSNPGVGIVKAGWHCNGSPQSSGAPNACPECAPCNGTQCVPKALCSSSCGPEAGQELGPACDGKGNCLSGPALLPQICKQVTIQSSFTTQSCPPGTCGLVLNRNFQSVDPHCDDLSLGDVNAREGITLPSVSCPGFGSPLIGKYPFFMVTPANLIFGFTDMIGFCLNPADIALGTCTETVFQSVYLNETCRVERNRITFTTVNNGITCVGGVDFQSLGN